ncbi:hypothetical protein [Rhizobium laguerreae]|uniref:hypothetical protein n=1 Tax=Rhizobium laguerreae TaxID=1076926 RepID=UPI0028AC120C|nr:hypothetical protein [Rhizobium laguerreae]
MRGFVDEAHRIGIGVILDVVYNHFGKGERFANSRQTISQSVTRTNGASRSTSTVRTAVAFANMSRRTRPTGSMNSTLMDCVSTPRRPCSIRATNTSSLSLRGRLGQQRDSGRSTS